MDIQTIGDVYEAAMNRKKPPRVKSKESVVLAIGDLHAPFTHPDALDFLVYVRDRFNPTIICAMGDEVDFHAFARWPMDPDGLSPGKELAAAVETLIPFYREFPNVLVCESNHTVRPWKKSFEAGLPEAFLPTYAKLLNAPDGWHWAIEHEIDGVVYVHGDPYCGKNADSKWRQEKHKSAVIGHVHSFAGVRYHGNLFSMNVGCLIDDKAYAFKYARKMPVKVNLGCGLVVNGESAFFIPMRLDKHDRWIGRL